MTIISQTTHPNGTTFQYVVPYTVHKHLGKLVRIKDKIGSRGVRIIYPDGKIVFRSNKEYKHIDE